jgi:lipid-binding SYLF domain-containing protein
MYLARDRAFVLKSLERQLRTQCRFGSANACRYAMNEPMGPTVGPFARRIGSSNRSKKLVRFGLLGNKEVVMFNLKKPYTIVFPALFAALLAGPAGAQQPQNTQEKNQKKTTATQNTERDRNREKSDEADRAAEATGVLTEIMNVPENAIPEELMARAHGIAVIPHVVKGAFGIGGQWGKGLMSQRREDGSWSPPAYVEIGGGNFGFQIGVQATDVVLVFTDETGVKGLLKGKVKLGADASATAGPVGRKAEVGTDILLRSGVFSYSRSKGLFAGVSLDGSVIRIDDSANWKVYGKELTAEQILLGNQVRTNSTVDPFVKTLQKVSPPHVHAAKKS